MNKYHIISFKNLINYISCQFIINLFFMISQNHKFLNFIIYRIDN